MKLIRILFIVILLVLVWKFVDQQSNRWAQESTQEHSTEVNEQLVDLVPGIKVDENSTKVVAFGESGTGTFAQLKLAELINQLTVDAFIHTGNLAYDSGSADEIDKFFEPNYTQNVKSNFYPAIGDRDNLTDNAAPYLDRFQLPEVALNPSENERYYSLDLANIHLVSLDSTLALGRISEAVTDDMADWLSADLRSAPKNSVTIVYLNHPAITSASAFAADNKVKEQLAPIFDEFSVDFVISAQNRNYQRTCPLNLSRSGDACTSPGTVYLVSGGGGAPLDEFTGDKEDFIARRELEHHFLLFEVAADGRIHLRAYNADGQTIDDVNLKKRF